MACRSACTAPGSHATLGECIRASGIRIGQVDATRQHKWDAELNAYQAARDQGIQPAGTKMFQVRAAVDASDKSGSAYDAGRGM